MTAIETIAAKRGATFRVRRSVAFDPEDGWTFTAAVRCGSFDDTLDVRILEPSTDDYGLVELSATAEQTALWPPRVMQADFRGEREDGEAAISETFEISVTWEVSE